MTSGTTRLFTVISGLTKCAQELETQSQAEARASIDQIELEVDFLRKNSITKKSEYKESQQDAAKKLNVILLNISELEMQYNNTNDQIRNIKKRIHTNNTEKSLLEESINSLHHQLDRTNEQIRNHQLKINELNDTSFGSIFRSVMCLGLDRATMGIVTLIEQDSKKINTLKQELKTYNDEIMKNNNKACDILNILEGLDHQLALNNKMLTELKVESAEIHGFEIQTRKLVSFLTQISLFYGKLLVKIQTIDNKLENVLDIIEMLNDNEPTISDFNSSGSDLISLKEALYKFDILLKREPVANLL